MNNPTVRQVKSLCIAICIENGINSPKAMRQIMQDAAKGVKKMSVAGVKAALTKGQTIAGFGF